MTEDPEATEDPEEPVVIVVEPTKESEASVTDPEEEPTVVLASVQNRDANGPIEWVYPDEAQGISAEDALRENLRREAAYYYGPNAVEPQTNLLTVISENPTSNIMAGQALTFSVDFRTGISRYYSGPGVDTPRPLFENWQNAKLIFKLPNSLKMNKPSEFSFSSVVTQGDYTLYTIDLGTVNFSDSKQFTYTVDVLGNGTQTAIRDVDLTDMVTYQADIVVYDNYNNYPDPLVTYPQQTVADGGSFRTVRGPSTWGVNKTQVSDDVEPDTLSAGDTFTLSWTVDVGLLDGETVIKMDSASAQNSYSQRYGITPIKNAALTDTFSASYTGKNGQVYVMPDSVTIKKVGATGNGTTLDFTDADNDNKPDAPVSIPLMGNLAINQNIKVDSDADHNPDQDIDTYTSYLVTATFTVTEDMVADFPENTNYVFTGVNKAATDIEFYEVEAHDTDDTDNIENTQLLPAIKPAKLTISKEFTDYKGNTKPYSQYGETVYGPMTYTLTRTDNEAFFVYTYDETNGYQPTATTAATSYDK